MKTIYQTAFFLCVTAAVLLTSCTDDGTPDGAAERELHLMPDTRQFGEDLDGVTRAATPPSGYEVYTGEDVILGYIINTETSEVASRLFTLSDEAPKDWRARITITDADPAYMVYGYLPYSEATPVNATYNSSTRGVTLTIQNLPVLSTEDPCVITGVMKAANKTADVTLQLGKFDYQFNPEPGSDYVYILLDHIYSRLQFSIKVDSKYAALRTIHIKDMKLEAINSSGNTLKSKNAEVIVTPNSVGNNPITSISHPSGSEVTGASPTPLYEGETDLVLTTAEQSLGSALYVPRDQRQYRLTTTYDIYDNNGNMIRQEVNVANTFILDAMNNGFTYPVKINVSPTYLYVLSEPDLDSPTITIN